jgi:hypothetical protein
MLLFLQCAVRLDTAMARRWCAAGVAGTSGATSSQCCKPPLRFDFRVAARAIGPFHHCAGHAHGTSAYPSPRPRAVRLGAVASSTPVNATP